MVATFPAKRGTTARLKTDFHAIGCQHDSTSAWTKKAKRLRVPVKGKTSRKTTTTLPWHQDSHCYLKCRENSKNWQKLNQHISKLKCPAKSLSLTLPSLLSVSGRLVAFKVVGRLTTSSFSGAFSWSPKHVVASTCIHSIKPRVQSHSKGLPNVPSQLAKQTRSWLHYKNIT